MIITVNVQATPDWLSIQVPQANMTIEHPHIVAYRASTNAVCAIGKTEDMLQREAPEYWQAYQTDIHFAYPFAVRTPAPVFAAAVLNYQTYAAYQHIRTRFNYFWSLIDRLDYDLRIRDYETLPLAARAQFARQLDRSLLLRHRLCISSL